ncbi:MAG: hypothetical protein LBH43_12175 [Treponema sp.]|nr:hypothetical protein [Treponema sp.]
MKKIIIAVVFAALIFNAIAVFAAENGERPESEFYYVNITLEKIWPYRRGYIVQYRKGFGRIGRLYLPSEWFSDAAGKGEIIALPRGQSWPNMSIYYKNGEFSHIRLYVHRWASHPSWGNVQQTVNIDSNFDNIETLKINFQ